MAGYPNTVEVFPKPLISVRNPSGAPTYRPVKASPTHPAALHHYPKRPACGRPDHSNEGSDLS